MSDEYGTVMIGRLAVPIEEALNAARQWADERKVPGFRHEDIMLCDDGVTVVMAVKFASKADYDALADDPAQDAWYTERLRPLLAEDPQWLDGHWRSSVDA
jgi:hypothetical protein